MDPEAHYKMLGRLIEEAPDPMSPITKETMLWLGRADALVASSGDKSESTAFRSNMGTFTAFPVPAMQQMQLILYRVLAAAELKAPAGVRGAFIPAGNAFDAFTGLTKVLSAALSDVFIVDAYLDSRILTDFAGSIPAGVPLRLLADEKTVYPTLSPAAERWGQQHGSTRPLEVRLAPARSLHDRAIFIDKKIAWTVSQSFKDFATRSPAEIVSAGDIADQKIPAYEEIWNSSRLI